MPQQNLKYNDWPQYGVVVFRNVEARYRDNLDTVLKDISFTIKSKEKIGVVGRTGVTPIFLQRDLLCTPFWSYGFICLRPWYLAAAKTGRRDGETKSLWGASLMVPSEFQATLWPNLTPTFFCGLNFVYDQSGKSTITLCMLRVLELFKGQIVIDGVDISLLSLEELRSKITIILQDSQLF